MLIHGMWGGAFVWEHYRPFFERRGWTVITPTLRHHDVPADAPPPDPLGDTSLRDYAADLEIEIRKLASPPVLMGHSMGGLLAQILAARGLARAAVLLTPAAPSGMIALTPSVVRTFLRILSKPGFWKRPQRLNFSEAAYGCLNLMTPEKQKAEHARFRFESGRAAFEIGFWYLDARHAARVDATQVKCPVLIVGGAQDRVTPASVVRKIARRYARTMTYKEFPDHSHWVIAEDGWEDVAGFAADWLDRTLGPSPN